MLVQELGCPGGKGTEEQALFAVDDSGVEMRHRHGRRGAKGLPIHLGLVTLDNGRIVADQPLSADRKSAQAVGFGQSGLL